MATLSPIEMAVLDGTARSPENLEQIYQRLHNSPAGVPLADAADAVCSLVEKGLLAPVPGGEQTSGSPLIDPQVVWKGWFEMTSQGRELLAAAAPKIAARLSYFGIGEGMMLDIPFEVFKENRRDMSRKYSDQADDE